MIAPVDSWVVSCQPGFAKDDLAAVKVGQNVVRVNPKFYRPAEVELLIGSPEKAKRELGWEPKTTLEELCQMMVAADKRHIDKGVSF